MPNNKLWFKAKKYGWGWYPSSWQGWIVMFVYCIAILVIALNAINVTKETTNTSSTFLWNYLPPLFFISFIMIGICYKTGEKPKWRWGEKR